LNKEKELEYVLMQSCTERDKQSKIIDELTHKYLVMENDKNELENLVRSVFLIDFLTLAEVRNFTIYKNV
jgi:hypothetical protein